MLAQTDHDPAEVGPDTLAPLCDEAEFAELVKELVADEAPRLFAVVQEYGERVDGRIAAWGIAFEECAEVFGVDRSQHLRLPSAERAARAFSRRPQITARVVWVDPEPPTRPSIHSDVPCDQPGKPPR
ncbi:MAG: hypothetical protein ACRDRX_16140 [Pseudonocardiaceae bacterium]